MVHAEKIVTAISRGTANTRWRDFGDVYVLSGTHPVTAAELRAAMAEVARHRGVKLQPLELVLDGYELVAQTRRWAVELEQGAPPFGELGVAADRSAGVRSGRHGGGL